MILAQQQKRQQAVDAFEAALRNQPDSWEALTALASVLDQQGRMAAALATHRKMLELRPGHPVSANNVAWILATSPDASLRDPAEAIEHAEHVCRVTRNRLPSALDTLAAAYASAGRFAEAVDTAQNALALATESGQPAVADKIKARLHLYENNQPYRQPPVTDG
jgi:Flp pilus assembly protein TadD